MTGTISFLTVGSLLLVVLFLFLRRTVSAQRKLENLSDAHEALNELQSELLPDWFVDRLFSKEDLDFVHAQASSHIPVLFHRERRMVALSWLKQTQEHVARLMDFHLRMARQRPDLKPIVELKLTFEYAQFQLLCKLLAGLIRMVGPMRVRSVAGYAVNIATHLGAVSEKALADLNNAVPVNAEGN
jgi:hypothetical protein